MIALEDYAPRVQSLISQLQSRVAEAVSQNQVVDVSKLFSWFAFDVMGEVVFGRPFDMLKNAAWNTVIVDLHSASSVLGPLSPTPWLAHLGLGLMPRVWKIKHWYAMMDWCFQQAHERLDVSCNEQMMDQKLMRIA